MLRLKMIINVLLFLTISLCLHPVDTSIAGDCSDKGASVGTPTVTGNYNYAQGHTCTKDPDMEYDTANSHETIARNGSANLFVTGNNGPFTWSVSGEGFTLEKENEPTGPTNTLYADGTACGAATIIVTGCDGQEVIGYVRCMTGQWTTISSCNNIGVGKCPSWFCSTYHIDGKYKYDQNWLFVPLPSPYCEEAFGNCDDCGSVSTYEEVGPGVGGQCPPNHPYFCRVSQLITYEWVCAPE